MKLIGVAVSALVPLTALQARACDILYDPRPSWEQMIEESDVVFVGRVIDAKPADEQALAGRVVFEVEMPVKGDVGALFEFQLGTSSCDTSFGLGAHVIFAGTTFVLDDGTQHIWARDSGWDPTVFLDNPPTPEQQTKLDYLSTITKVR